MTEQNKTLKFVVFAASCIVIPTINRLLQQQQLAGVVLIERIDNDSHQLEQQLHQAQIAYLRYNTKQPEQVANQLEKWQADVGLIFTFAHILPANILNKTRLGMFNLHASSLPKYKGAMPLYWQIRHGETESELSLIKVESSVDSGDIALQMPLSIHPLDTLQSLTATVAAQTPILVEQFIERLSSDSLVLKPQVGDSTFAPRPSQQDLIVNWQQMTAQDICCAARAGNPTLNGIAIMWNQNFIGLLQATEVEYANYGLPAGTVLHVGEPEGVIIATKQGSLRLDVIAITEGVYGGLAFASRFKLDAGVQFLTPDNLQ